MSSKWLYLLPSLVGTTHAPIVAVGIALSSHKRFITSCRSIGAKRLYRRKQPCFRHSAFEYEEGVEQTGKWTGKRRDVDKGA
jgi:hypothetical protein